MSPYLFVLCIERLSHLIYKEVLKGAWKGIKLSRRGPIASHLFFTEDMVFFAKATIKQIDVVMRCLNPFFVSLGRRVNFNKSSIFVSKNVDPTLANQLATMSNIPITDCFGKYLGVPSIHGRVKGSLYQDVIDRVSARLEGWKAKYLSFVGRHVLAQSVLSVIPLYSMQTGLFPVGVCNKIEASIRTFLWGGNSEHRKPSLISWEVVSKPKRLGGLGILSLQHMNLAFMAKMGWRIVQEFESLWSAAV